SVSVVQALDQVRVPRPAATRADREPAGEVRLGRRREGARLLVADVDPFDAFGRSDRVHEGVQAVTDHAVHTGDASLDEDVDKLLSDGAHCGLLLGRSSSRRNDAWWATSRTVTRRTRLHRPRGSSQTQDLAPGE